MLTILENEKKIKIYIYITIYVYRGQSSADISSWPLSCEKDAAKYVKQIG